VPDFEWLRQLTGSYGGHDWLYMQGPFSSTPLPTQELQLPLTSSQQRRRRRASVFRNSPETVKAERGRVTGAGD
jgi:hypothetical protein